MSGRGGGGGRVCSFYQQGRCKFGDSCKFEHPGAHRQQESGNRFQALGNQGNSYGHNNNYRPSGPGRGQQYNSNNPFGVTTEGIEADLRNERPIWPFSAYGPGHHAPLQLFGGYPVEQSPEELRVLHYQAIANGNPQAAIQNEQELIAKTNQQIERALGDLDGAVKYILDGERQHPNRQDMCQAAVGNVFHKGRRLNSKFTSSAPAPNQAAGGGFGQPSSLGGRGGGGFGQASSLGQKQSPFGQPTNAGPAAGAFGSASTLGQQPSAFGQAAAGGFGQPSSLGPKSNAFGQPAAAAGGFGSPSPLGQVGAFGQPSRGVQASPFAQATQPTQQATGFNQNPAFGQPAAPAQQLGGFGQASAFGQQQNSGFGRPSTLGQQATPAFGQPSVAGQSNSAFGQPSVPGQQNTAFGQPSTTNQQSSPFGQASQNSAFGQPSAPGPQASPFGQPAQQGNTFGQAAHQATAFGQPSVAAPQSTAFGQASAPGQQPSAFGQAPQQQKPSPFGQVQSNAQQQSPFGQGSQAAVNQGDGGFGSAAPPPPQQQIQGNGISQAQSNPAPQGEWITRQANNQVKTFKGFAVQYIATGVEGNGPKEPHYRKSDGSVERIWHPDGMPAHRSDMEAAAEMYTAEVEAAYKYVADHGTFKDGIMPEIAPKCEWIRWDL